MNPRYYSTQEHTNLCHFIRVCTLYPAIQLTVYAFAATFFVALVNVMVSFYTIPTLLTLIVIAVTSYVVFRFCYKNRCVDKFLDRQVAKSLNKIEKPSVFMTWITDQHDKVCRQITVMEEDNDEKSA